MSEKPTKVGELFPSRFITPGDLNGRSYTLVIERVELEQMRSQYTNQDEWKGVVYFRGAQKGMVLNVTRARALAKLAGSDEFEQWAGLRVMIHAGMAHNGKRTVIVRAAPEEELDKD